MGCCKLCFPSLDPRGKLEGRKTIGGRKTFSALSCFPLANASTRPISCQKKYSRDQNMLFHARQKQLILPRNITLPSAQPPPDNLPPKHRNSLRSLYSNVPDLHFSKGPRNHLDSLYLFQESHFCGPPNSPVPNIAFCSVFLGQVHCAAQLPGSPVRQALGILGPGLLQMFLQLLLVGKALEAPELASIQACNQRIADSTHARWRLGCPALGTGSALARKAAVPRGEARLGSSNSKAQLTIHFKWPKGVAYLRISSHGFANLWAHP